MSATPRRPGRLKAAPAVLGPFMAGTVATNPISYRIVGRIRAAAVPADGNLSGREGRGCEVRGRDTRVVHTSIRSALNSAWIIERSLPQAVQRGLDVRGIEA